MNNEKNYNNFFEELEKEEKEPTTKKVNNESLYSDFFKEMEENAEKREAAMMKYKFNNDVAYLLKILCVIELAIGFIAGIILSLEEENAALLFEIWIASGISGLFIYALGEIIQILHESRLINLKNSKNILNALQKK